MLEDTAPHSLLCFVSGPLHRSDDKAPSVLADLKATLLYENPMSINISWALNIDSKTPLFSAVKSFIQYMLLLQLVPSAQDLM